MYSGVISRFIDDLMTDSQPVIYGDGEHSRDFTYIANVVDANIKAQIKFRQHRHPIKKSGLKAKVGIGLTL